MNSKEINMEESIFILKEFTNKYLNIDLEKNYSVTLALVERTNQYELNIEHKEKEEEIRFFIDKQNGEIENFRYGNYKLSNSNLPIINMEEGEVIAHEFLKKLLGERVNNLVLNSDITLVGSQLNQYTYWYKEFINEIEVNKSYAMIYVDGNSNKVVYYDNNLAKYSEIQDESKIISQKEALELFKENMNLTLDTSQDDDLIYEPTTAIEGHFICAKDKEYINEYEYMDTEENIETHENLNIINQNRAREIFFDNIKVEIKYIAEGDLLKLVYCIKPKGNNYYGVAINATNGSLNEQYATYEGEAVDLYSDLYGRKYERELKILVDRNIIDEDFNLELNSNIGDVIRLIVRIRGSRIEYLDEEQNEDKVQKILFTDIDDQNPYFEDIQNAIADRLIQNEEKPLNVFRDVTIKDLEDLILYEIDSYEEDEAYQYKKIIRDILSVYPNEKINNETLAYIFYRIFSR